MLKKILSLLLAYAVSCILAIVTIGLTGFFSLSTPDLLFGLKTGSIAAAIIMFVFAIIWTFTKKWITRYSGRIALMHIFLLSTAAAVLSCLLMLLTFAFWAGWAISVWIVLFSIQRGVIIGGVQAVIAGVARSIIPDPIVWFKIMAIVFLNLLFVAGLHMRVSMWMAV